VNRAAGLEKCPDSFYLLETAYKSRVFQGGDLMNTRATARSLRWANTALLALAIFSPQFGFAQAHEAQPAIRNVTDDPTGIDYGPHFSPDGRYLIFDRTALVGGNTSRTYIVPFAGGAAKPLSTGDVPVDQTRTRWSPDGNLIAFTGIASDHTAATWLMDKDGSHIRKTPFPNVKGAVYPSWYPDGHRILEMVADDLSLRCGDIRTGKVETIATTPALMTGMASVSPDGKWIAAAGQLRTGQPYDQRLNQIWLIDDSGHAHPLLAHPTEGRAPNWSPDGIRVVFESNQGSPSPGFYAIFVANRDGSGLRQLTSFDRNAQHPIWSPDGKWIAFSERTQKAIGYGQSVAVMTSP
jgi:Tol biopolymer transport system component